MGTGGAISQMVLNKNMKQGIKMPTMHRQTQILAQVSPIGPIMHPKGRNRFLPGQASYSLAICCPIIIKYPNILNIPVMQAAKPSYTKKINKILYIAILMTILYIILFYLDILNYLSLENIVSVMLGFLILIIVQMRFISYYFEDKMRELDLDQVGIVQDFIRNKIFGEINPNYIAKKQKIKYYQYTKDDKDRLFADDNSQTFECVMAVLRSKNEMNNNNRHKMVKEKWEVFIAKIGQFEVFLSNLHKFFKEKNAIYNKKFNDKTSAFKDEDYQKWSVLFSPHRHPQIPESNETSKQLQKFDPTNWVELKTLMQQKFTINQSITKQISTLLVNQYNVYAGQMRAQMRQVTADLQTSDNENAASKRSYREIIDKIKATNEKIENLIKKFNQKTKGSENMELIVNIQYDIRFLRLQLDNLEVRKTYAKDMIHKNAENEYSLCVKTEHHLEDSGIKKFNNKILHYLLSFFDKVKHPMQKIKEIRQSNLGPQGQLMIMKNLYNNSIKQVSQNNQLQRRLKQFNFYLSEMLSAVEEEVKSCKKINGIIKEYDKEWKTKSSQFRFGQQTAVGEKVIDTMFLEMIQSMNDKQIEVLSKFINILKEQQKAIEEKMEKMEKKENFKFQILNKIPSYLPEALLCFQEGYDIILKEVEQKRQLIEKKSKDFDLENPRIMKMNEYKNQILKLERQELQYEQAEKKDQKDLDRQSLKFANRIIDVFASEWRNSEFFHGILKEEIQISLNTKRPPFLNYLTVKHIKVHEKQPQTIKGLKVLGDNVFLCSFELLVNFDGKIAVHIETFIKQNKTPINIKLLITHFKCPIRVCLSPFCLGKSNVCMKQTPQLSLEFSAKLGSFELARIPFLSLFIKLFIVIKLRKKFLFPKKATIKVPMAVKNAVSQAIKQQVNFQKLMEKKKKSD